MSQAVGAIIINQKNEFLLMLRDDSAPRFPNMWCLLGGGVEETESVEEALWRELGEEAQFDRSMAVSVKKFLEFENAASNRIHFYAINTKVGLDELVRGEGAALEYVSVEELFDREFGFGIEHVLRLYLMEREL